MHIYSFTMYGIAEKANYNNRRDDIKTLEEALEEILKLRFPLEYMITKTEFTRVFDDSSIFQRETIQKTKKDISIWEIRQCDEIGHDYRLKYFADIQKAFDFSNTQEKCNPGWHFYHIEHKI